MMQFVKILNIILSILRLNVVAVNGSVKSCKEEIEKNRICFKNIVGSNTTYVDSYQPPSPVVVNSTIMLLEVIEINEKESSITVRVLLITRWSDPRVGLSNRTIA